MSDAHPDEAVQWTGELMAQAEAALAAGDIARVNDILYDRVVEIGMHHLDRLEALARSIPDDAVAEHPRLAVLRHGIATFVDQANPTVTFDISSALRTMHPEGSPLADHLVAGLGQIFALRASGRHTDAVDVAEADRRRVAAERGAWLDIPGPLRSIVLLQWGLCRLLTVDLDGAVADFQEAFFAGRRTELPHFARNGAENAALLLALTDSLPEAEEWLANARSIPPAPHPLRRFVEEADPLVEAAIALARLEIDDARKALDRFTPSPDTNLLWSTASFLRAKTHLLAGEALEGLDLVDRSRPPRGGTVESGSFDESLLALAESELALLAGRAPRAAKVLDRVAPSPLLAVARARLALLTGDAAGALAIATSLREPTTFGRIDLAAIAAVASEHLARPEEADRNLQLAVRLAHARGTVAPFVLLPRVDVEALVARDREAEELLAPVLASTSTSIERVDAVRLSARERLVLAELARSGSASEIAERLFVSVNTIKSQLRSIYRKLDVASREEALTEAARLGFDLDARD